jgi:hypothetical protein
MGQPTSAEIVLSFIIHGPADVGSEWRCVTAYIPLLLHCKPKDRTFQLQWYQRHFQSISMAAPSPEWENDSTMGCRKALSSEWRQRHKMAHSPWSLKSDNNSGVHISWYSESMKSDCNSGVCISWSMLCTVGVQCPSLRFGYTVALYRVSVEWVSFWSMHAIVYAWLSQYKKCLPGVSALWHTLQSNVSPTAMWGYCRAHSGVKPWQACQSVCSFLWSDFTP